MKEKDLKQSYSHQELMDSWCWVFGRHPVSQEAPCPVERTEVLLSHRPPVSLPYQLSRPCNGASTAYFIGLRRLHRETQAKF
jgi:hypothetical protein